MPQTSYPTIGYNFTDLEWHRANLGANGIIGDLTGGAYNMTRNGITASFNNIDASLDSLATVAGFGHAIPSGEYEALTIHAATYARTDLIVLRYSTEHHDQPGPIRITHLADTNTYNPLTDLPLYKLTFAANQTISDCTVTDMRQWLGATIWTAAETPLPETAPLATLIIRGSERRIRTRAGWVSA